MNRPTGGGGTTIRTGPGRKPAPGKANVPSRQAPPSDRQVRRAGAERFFRELVAEMRRVTWPSRPEWVSATVLTIGLVIFVGLYTYVIDQAFGWLFGFVHH